MTWSQVNPPATTWSDTTVASDGFSAVSTGTTTWNRGNDSDYVEDDYVDVDYVDGTRVDWSTTSGQQTVWT